MKALLAFLLLFSISLSAQTKKASNTLHTAVNGKTYDYNGKPVPMTKTAVINSTISLKSDNPDQELPAIKKLEVFIPGYPALLIDGNKIDKATADKINSSPEGNAIVIRALPEGESPAMVFQVELTD